MAGLFLLRSTYNQHKQTSSSDEMSTAPGLILAVSYIYALVIYAPAASSSTIAKLMA
jgi:hypothetical protein